MSRETDRHEQDAAFLEKLREDLAEARAKNKNFKKGDLVSIDTKGQFADGAYDGKIGVVTERTPKEERCENLDEYGVHVEGDYSDTFWFAPEWLTFVESGRSDFRKKWKAAYRKANPSHFYNPRSKPKNFTA